MNRKLVLISLLVLIHTPLVTGQTPTPTPTPLSTGDLWWSRNVYVSNAYATPEAPIQGADVDAQALTSDSCTTAFDGWCSVMVLAHDTGSVNIDVAAVGYQPFSASYPGLPPSGDLYIQLEPDIQTPSTNPRGMVILLIMITISLIISIHIRK